MFNVKRFTKQYIRQQNVPDQYQSPLKVWDGYLSDSFFSGVLVRYADDCESVVVARYCN